MKKHPIRRIFALILAFALVSDPATAAFLPFHTSIPAPRSHLFSIFSEQALAGHVVEMLHPISNRFSASRLLHSQAARGRHVSGAAVFSAALAVSAAALISGWHPALMTWAALPKLFLATSPLAWVPKPRARRAAEQFQAYRDAQPGDREGQLAKFYELVSQGLDGERFIGKGGPRVPKVKAYALAQNFEDLRKMEATARREKNRNIYLWGPHGTGKNYRIDLFAAMRNQGRTIISAHEDMTVDDIFERQVLRPAPGSTAAVPLRETRWELNDFALSMMSGEIGVWDEYNRMPDKVKAALNDALQRRSFTRKDGTVVAFHPDALVTATSNPPESQSGNTYTTAEQVSRFNNIEVGYLGAEDERKILEEEAPGVDTDVIKELVAVAGEIRGAKRTDSGMPVSPISTRELLMVVKHVQMFPGDLKHMGHVFSKAYMPPDDQPEVQTLVEGLLLKHGFVDEAYEDLKPGDWAIEEREGKRFLRIGEVECALREGQSHIPAWVLTEAQKQPQNLRVLQDLLKAVVLKQHIFIEGEAGVGKDKLLDVLLGALEYPVYLEPINENTTADDIMGWYELEGSLQKWHAAKLEKAVGANGIYYMSEINRCKPGTTAAVYGFMESGSVLLGNQEVLDANDKEHFLVIATANPFRRPFSAYPMPAALKSRFAKFRIAFLPEKQEVKMLAGDYPKVDEEVVSRLVKGANLLRQEHKAGAGTIPYQVGGRLLEQVLEALVIDPDNYLGQSAVEVFLDAYGAISQGEEVAEVVKANIRRVLLGMDVRLQAIEAFRPAGVGRTMIDPVLKDIHQAVKAGEWSGVHRGLRSLTAEPQGREVLTDVAQELNRLANLASVPLIKDAIIQSITQNQHLASLPEPVSRPQRDVSATDHPLVAIDLHSPRAVRQQQAVGYVLNDVTASWSNRTPGGLRMRVNIDEGALVIFRDVSAGHSPTIIIKDVNGQAIIQVWTAGHPQFSGEAHFVQIAYSAEQRIMYLVLNQEAFEKITPLLLFEEWNSRQGTLEVHSFDQWDVLPKPMDLQYLYESVPLDALTSQGQASSRALATNVNDINAEDIKSVMALIERIYKVGQTKDYPEFKRISQELNANNGRLGRLLYEASEIVGIDQIQLSDFVISVDSSDLYTIGQINGQMGARLYEVQIDAAIFLGANERIFGGMRRIPHAYKVPLHGIYAKDYEQDRVWAKKILDFDEKRVDSNSIDEHEMGISPARLDEMLNQVDQMKAAFYARESDLLHPGRDTQSLTAMLTYLSQHEVLVGRYPRQMYRENLYTGKMKDVSRLVRVKAVIGGNLASEQSIEFEHEMVEYLGRLWNISDFELLGVWEDHMRRSEPFEVLVKTGRWKKKEFRLPISVGSPLGILTRLVEDLKSLQKTKDAWVAEKLKLPELEKQLGLMRDKDQSTYEWVLELAHGAYQPPPLHPDQIRDAELEAMIRDYEVLKEHVPGDGQLWASGHDHYRLDDRKLDRVLAAAQAIYETILERQKDGRDFARPLALLKYLAVLEVYVGDDIEPNNGFVTAPEHGLTDVADTVRSRALEYLRQLEHTIAPQFVPSHEELATLLAQAWDIKEPSEFDRNYRNGVLRQMFVKDPYSYELSIGLRCSAYRMLYRVIEELQRQSSKLGVDWLADASALPFLKTTLADWERTIREIRAAVDRPAEAVAPPAKQVSVTTTPQVTSPLISPRPATPLDARHYIVEALREAMGLEHPEDVEIVDPGNSDIHIVRESVTEGIRYAHVILDALVIVPAAVEFILNKAADSVLALNLPDEITVSGKTVGDAASLLRERAGQWQTAYGGPASVASDPNPSQTTSSGAGSRPAQSAMELFQESFNALPQLPALMELAPHIKHYSLESDPRYGPSFISHLTIALPDRPKSKTAYISINTADRPIGAPLFELKLNEDRKDIKLEYSTGDPSEGTYQKHEGIIPASVFRGYKLTVDPSGQELPKLHILITHDVFNSAQNGFRAGFTLGAQSKKPGFVWAFVPVDEESGSTAILPSKNPYTIPPPVRQETGYVRYRQYALHSVLSTERRRMIQVDDDLNANHQHLGRKLHEYSEPVEAERIQRGDVLIQETVEGRVRLIQALGPLQAVARTVLIDPLTGAVANGANEEEHETSFKSGSIRRLATAEALGSLQQDRVHASDRLTLLKAVKAKSMQRLMHHENVLSSDFEIFSEWWGRHVLTGPVGRGDLLLVDLGSEGKRLMLADQDLPNTDILRAVSVDGRETIEVRGGDFRKIAHAAEVSPVDQPTSPLEEVILQTLTGVFDVEPYLSLMRWIGGPGILGAKIEYQNSYRPMLIGISMGSDTPIQDIYVKIAELIRDLWKDNSGPDVEELRRRVDQLEALARGTQPNTKPSVDEKVVFRDVEEAAMWVAATFHLTEGDEHSLLGIIRLKSDLGFSVKLFENANMEGVVWHFGLENLSKADTPQALIKTIMNQMERLRMNSGAGEMRMIRVIQEKLKEIERPTDSSRWRRDVIDFLRATLGVPVLFAPSTHYRDSMVRLHRAANTGKVDRIYIDESYETPADALWAVSGAIRNSRAADEQFGNDAQMAVSEKHDEYRNAESQARQKVVFRDSGELVHWMAITFNLSDSSIVELQEAFQHAGPTRFIDLSLQLVHQSPIQGRFLVPTADPIKYLERLRETFSNSLVTSDLAAVVGYKLDELNAPDQDSESRRQVIDLLTKSLGVPVMYGHFGNRSKESIRIRKDASGRMVRIDLNVRITSRTEALEAVIKSIEDNLQTRFHVREMDLEELKEIHQKWLRGGTSAPSFIPLALLVAVPWDHPGLAWLSSQMSMVPWFAAMILPLLYYRRVMRAWSFSIVRRGEQAADVRRAA